MESHLFGLAYSGAQSIAIKKSDLMDAEAVSGNNPVTAQSKATGKRAEFQILEPDELSIPQPGDGTVPVCSGEAPLKQGGLSVRQGFRLEGFEHGAAYDDENARNATLYAICKLLSEVKNES